ncbi:hypothetical protein TWF718_004256 [Orbilia javanica]|uniref:Myb-like DNA-binding domain-containing protein n=1 Tax=Orbilia javanica TaxID=47235 RepID=A0AAN8RKU6_9PEZI
MAPSTSADDQFLFLVSCIKNSNNGKVNSRPLKNIRRYLLTRISKPDFALVAKERGIVSRGAAAKRFSRLMAAHGISLSNGQTSPKKGPKSPPMTDEDEERSEGPQDDLDVEEIKVEELANTSKKRKRESQQQTLRKRVKRETKSPPNLEENGRNTKIEETVEDE